MILSNVQAEFVGIVFRFVVTSDGVQACVPILFREPVRGRCVFLEVNSADSAVIPGQDHRAAVTRHFRLHGNDVSLLLFLLWLFRRALATQIVVEDLTVAHHPRILLPFQFGHESIVQSIL